MLVSMRNSQLNRVFNLMRRTGDKAIVLDPGSDQVFVMMNLDNYEGLLDEVDYLAPKKIAGETPDPIKELDSEILADVYEEAAAPEAPQVEREPVEAWYKPESAPVVAPIPERVPEVEVVPEVVEEEPISIIPIEEPPLAPVAPLKPLVPPKMSLSGMTGVGEILKRKSLDFSEGWSENPQKALLREDRLDDVPEEDEEEKFYLEPV